MSGQQDNFISPKTVSSTVFDEAKDIIFGDREKTYGHPDINLKRIAKQWGLYLNQKYGYPISITLEDVCWMMADLKKVRQMNESKRDNIVDGIGYIGLISRIGESENGNQTSRG